MSSPGKQDGLYWEVAKDQPASPLGRLDEFAKDVVTSTQPGAAPISDGYSFRVLAKQGNHATGNARSYVKNGEMTEGFAIPATPVTYADSGIMSFMMNRHGIVYQKDLGSKTNETAAAINSYDPDSSWTSAK
ncbi:MAG TPA: DUF2950 family protein [Edaphobacter sp.]|nr:DUF2950 family protein [Edaphobacter sp.]